MNIASARTLIALLLLALPVCWGEVFPDNALIAKVELLTSVPEVVSILLFGIALLTLSSFMRVRTLR